MTRVLPGAALSLALTGALMGVLEARSLVHTSFAHLDAYAMAQAALCTAAIVLSFRSFRDEIRRDLRNWHRPILRSAPRWAGGICAAGIAGSVAYVIGAVGGSVSATDWGASVPHERAALFVSFSIFTYLALIGLSAATGHDRSE